jgi:oligoendopeptidase F
MILTREKLEKQAPYFYPDDLDISNWNAISAAYDELEHMQISTPRDLLTMLYQANELLKVIYQAYNEVYFRTIADTSDMEARQKLTIMLNDILLPMEKRNAAVLQKYLEHPLRQQLSLENYRQYNANFETQIANSLQQNSDTTLEIAALTQEYKQLLSSVEVKLFNETYPLSMISHLLSTAEPANREEIWQARKEACLQHRTRFHSILDRLIKARNRLAVEAGHSHYYEYSLSTAFLGGMSIQQVNEIHKAVRKTVLPMVRNIIRQRQKRLNLKRIRPWDLEADPEAAALHPFSTTEELVGKSIRVLYDIRFEYGILLNKMHNTGFLELEYRPGKVKGEFNGAMPMWEAGIILMCCTGQHRDMVMLFHEMGHVLQSSYLFRSPLAMYFEVPVQVRELASQSLVYLSTAGWDEFYPDRNNLKTAFRSLYEYDLMQIVYWSIMNNFELVLYANPDWKPEQREKAMCDLWKQYDWGVDWSGLEDWQSIMWMQEFSLFELPHYSFLSSLSIFNVWQILRNYRHDPMDTISRFQHYLEKVTEFDTEGIFRELNIRQDFSEKNMQKMVDFILSEDKRIGG